MISNKYYYPTFLACCLQKKHQNQDGSQFFPLQANYLKAQFDLYHRHLEQQYLLYIYIKYKKQIEIK